MEIATLIPETHEEFDDEHFPIILSSENFPEFHWSVDMTNLIIERCLPPLSSSHLEKCTGTLTALTFWDMTTFENVQTCLKNLPNLRKLCFSNVLIDEYSVENAVLKCGSIIELPHLKELNFLSHCKVSKDDHWLLEFISRAVKCENLEKFSFFAEQDVGLFQPRRHNEVLEKFYSISNNCLAPLPARFMIQHWKSLKQILIGGHGVTLRPPCQKEGEKEEVNMSLVQLTTIYFQLDVPGIATLLNCQNNLTDLTCEDFSHISGILTTTTGDLEMGNHIFQSISSCISRNSTTLTRVDISPILVTEEELTPAVLEIFQIDCKSFQDCLSLKTLCLRLCFMEKFINFANSTQGQVINLHLLPSSLIEVEVNAAACNDEEIKLLGERIREFKKLRRLSIACPPSSPFFVGFKWLPALEELLPQNVNFFSGRMTPTDEIEAAEFVNGIHEDYELPPSRVTMTLNNRGVFFRI